MSPNRSSLYAGLALIALGIVFLATYLIPGSWPIVLVIIGIFFLVLAVVRRESWSITTGIVNTVLGSILIYQTITQNWQSWYFLWPLIFASVGAGLILTAQMEQRVRKSGYGVIYQRVSWGWLLLGLIAAAAFWIFRAQISWPSIIWGMGLFLLAQTLISGITALAIPGTILSGLGFLLAWQNLTGDWASWAYTWALIPALVGLGLFLAFIRKRIMRIIGLTIFGWSMIAFLVFGTFFASGGTFSRFWPISLIVAGMAVLAQGLLVKRQKS